jgi:crotonobetainyl-CoA:carnitine CoA-transferase CaiB-like acyl-CoA transferase
MQPLAGIRVLDFSTLLPGPLATLLLAEAGAEVIKIERRGAGDEMRNYTPKFGADSVNFAMLNRGKRSVAIDLKEPGAVERLMPLVASADVLVEQFRPGVMDRLGLGYDALSREHPRLIYCSITGYGQSGPRAGIAAHDLNYAADTGMLALAAGADGAPVPPAALVADIGGGSYPAVVNILLALRERDRTGRGCKLDVAMADNLFAFMYWAIGDGQTAGAWPRPGKALVTGGSPRYNVYRTRDDRFIAAAPLEEKFWQNFCDVLGLPTAVRDDERDPEAAIRAVAARIREKNGGRMGRRVRRKGPLLQRRRLHTGCARRSAFPRTGTVRGQAYGGRKDHHGFAGADRAAFPVRRRHGLSGAGRGQLASRQGQRELATESTEGYGR